MDTTLFTTEARRHGGKQAEIEQGLLGFKLFAIRE